MPKKFKIFLDSSALISGLNSPTGGAGIIISAFITGNFSIYVSNQVIDEVQQVIQLKFPSLKNRFLNFLLSRPKIITTPTIKEIRAAYNLIHSEDAPILAAAIKSRPDFLITWDTKHFLKTAVVSNVSFKICTPKEFIQKFWKNKKC